jgi:hypothetical protein
MKTLKSLIRASVCAGISLSLAGCLTSTPQWDAHFGETVLQLSASQVLNPEAGSNIDPVTGVDGGAAASAMFHYDKSFSQPVVVSSPFGAGIGSSGSSTGSP